jgi:hypothetical protein
VGFGIAQVINPAHQACTTEQFQHTGAVIFFICVTTPDVEDAVGRVEEKGGGLICKTVEPEEDLRGEVRKATYGDYHWSTVVEMLSCASDALMANRQWTWSPIDL